MTRRLAHLFKAGLLPLLLAVGLLGGLATEAAACAGEPVMEYGIALAEDAGDHDVDPGQVDSGACHHGHSHQGHALAPSDRQGTPARSLLVWRALAANILISAPPGGLERPPRI